MIVSGLNHAMHSGDGGDQEDPKQPPRKRTYNDDLNQLKDFNEGMLDAVMWIDGAAELSAVKWAALKLSAKGLFTFGAKNLIPEGKLGNHLFSSMSGRLKLVDTPANRALITKISNGKPLGVDAYGKSWYAQTLNNGQQIYSYSQNGIIKGAGINTQAVDLIARYGLK